MGYITYAYLISRLELFGFGISLAGAGMLVTGLLPKDKMEKVQTYLGGKAKYDNQPPLRTQLLVGGVIFLFLGLVVLQVIRL
jgi:hypothetical protein